MARVPKNFDYECESCGETFPHKNIHSWECPECGGQLHTLIFALAVQTYRTYSNPASYNIDRETSKEIAIKNWRHKENCGGKWSNPEVKKCIERAIEKMPNHQVASKEME